VGVGAVSVDDLAHRAVASDHLARPEVDEQYRDLMALQATAEMALNGGSLQDICDAILHAAVAYGAFDLGLVRVLDPATYLLDPVAQFGYRDPSRTEGQRRPAFIRESGQINAEVLTLRRARVIARLSATQRMRTLKREGVESVVVVPIRANTEVLGVMTLGTRVESAPTPSIVAVLETMATHLGVVLQRTRLQTELRHQALHDPLTGLGNRALYRQRLSELTEPSTSDLERGRDEFALIMLDLDDFKVVNDSLGHATGDALLIAAADRLRAIVGRATTVARLGGDEFVVLLAPASEASAVAVAEDVVAGFRREFFVKGQALRTTVSVGVTLSGADTDPEELLRSADLAMYVAKAAGKGKFVMYQPEMLVQAQQRLDLETHLRQALQRGEMSLAYQPIVDATTGAVRALEALLRWQHPVWGAVSPATFIPAAETSGTIVSLGEWVLRTACDDVQKVAAQHGRPVGIAVNVSVRQLQASDFVAVVRSALHDSGLEPALLTLEITETLLMDDDGRSTAVLRELHGLGVHLSIDDFGTGHSSLARLRTLPVSELKIDRAFVNEISADGDCGPIVTAVVAMARALGLSVVAEGVETPVQMQALQRLGCNAVQGFLISRPAPLADLQLDRVTVNPTAPRAASGQLVELVTQLRLHATAASTTSDPRTLVRDALAELVAVTGLQTMYLTYVDLSTDAQEVLLTHSIEHELVPEGLVVDWADTLCRQATDVGPAYTTNVPACFPDSRAALELGLMTYISVPIRRSDGQLVGTLCGASSEVQDLSRDTQTLIEIFAYVIGPQLTPTLRTERRTASPGAD
jgi:diguanylate cyclase (GGDEF)-like protein